MATNALGRGTVTLSINITEAERRIWGRLACERDMSTGALLKRAALAGMRQDSPATAEEIQAARERHRATKAGICLSAALLVIGLQFTQHQTDAMRRTSFRNRVSIRREVVS